MNRDVLARAAFRSSLLIFSGAFDAPAVQAQAVDARGRTVYEASFFTTFAPSNAYQMAQRVPGFTLEIGDTSVRGFAQAAGNVVINGQRPTSKSETLDVVLARIPAARVLRVEIGPGDEYGSEYSSKAQVLNLVLTAEAGLNGAVEAAVARAFAGPLLPSGNASALLKRGPSSFSLAASLVADFSPEEGYDRITTPAGVLVENREKRNISRNPEGAITATWEYAGGTNRTAHLNVRYAIDYFRLNQSNLVTPVVGIARHDSLTQRSDARTYEIGGDVTRPFLDGGLKLVGLATRRDRTNKDVQLNRMLDETLIGGNTQILIDRRDERVGRLTWNRDGLLGWSIETGFEGAFNQLDSDVTLTVLDSQNQATRISLPIDQAVVSEKRGEGFLNAGRGIAKGLRTDLGLNYEFSHLTVEGDAQADRRLKFLKPRATFDWRSKGGWHAQLSVRRTVAQLKFEDFISSAELTTLRVNGGNADLVPQRAWETLLTVDHALFGSGLVKVELGHNRVSLVQDRIPTPEGFDAPGNLGDGEEWIARTKIDMPLTRFGIRGGRLTLYGSYLNNSVEDPYTHQNRPFSGTKLFYFEVNFRQDLGKFAWGFELTGETPTTYYRLDEEDENSKRNPFATAFAEYRPSTKTTFTLNLENAISSPAYRDRSFYSPNRTAPAPRLIEHRRRNRHVIVAVGFKRNFG